MNRFLIQCPPPPFFFCNVYFVCSVLLSGTISHSLCNMLGLSFSKSPLKTPFLLHFQLPELVCVCVQPTHFCYFSVPLIWKRAIPLILLKAGRPYLGHLSSDDAHCCPNRSWNVWNVHEINILLKAGRPYLGHLSSDDAHCCHNRSWNVWNVHEKQEANTDQGHRQDDATSVDTTAHWTRSYNKNTNVKMNQLCYWHILNAYNEYIKFKLSQSSHFSLKMYIFQFLKLVLKMSQSLNMHVKCLHQKIFYTCSANLFVHSTKKKSKVDKIQTGLAL